MKKLTAALKKQITNDWQALFPELVVLEPMMLARRVGPLVQGVCLDRRAGDVYVPTTFVHCLCRVFPGVSLTLGQPLTSERNGAQTSIKAHFHEDHFVSAAQRLRESSLLSFAGDWDMSEVLSAYRAYRLFDRLEARFPVFLTEDAVSLWAWLGEVEQGRLLASHTLAEAQEWPPHVLARFGGVGEWQKTLDALATDVDRVRGNVDRQVETYSLGKLPLSRLSAERSAVLH